MRLSRSTSIVVTTTLVASGCSGHDVPPPDLTGGWQLTAAVIDGVRYLPADRTEGFHVTLVSITGRGGEAIEGCNLVTFKVVTDGSKFRLDASRAVMFGCLPTEDADPLDGHYLDALQGVTGGVRTGRSLTLTGPHVDLQYSEFDEA